MLNETDGGNFDVCNLADFLSEDEDTSVEWNSGCLDMNVNRVTECVNYELSDSEDSKWGDAADTVCREEVEHYNFDLLDGMTQMVFVPTPRKDRRRWPKEDLIYRPQLRETCDEYCASVFHTEIASPLSETAVSPPISVDVEVPLYREIVRDMESPTCVGTDLNIASVINVRSNDNVDVGISDRPVTDTDSELVIIDHPGPVGELWCKAGERMIPVRQDDMSCVCFLLKTVLSSTHRQAEISNIECNGLDQQCGACWNPDSNTHLDGHICFDCWCLMALCCSVSCLVTVATSRLIGIDQFIDCRHTYTWGSGLLCNLMTLCDANCLCAKMNRNFKGGLDNVMIEYNDTVDSRGLQRCADGQRSSLAHSSAYDTPIRETGRLGYGCTPVTASDWLYGCAVLFIPAGDVRIGYIRSAVGRGQSTDAAPVTGSLVFYTILRFYDYCAADIL